MHLPKPEQEDWRATRYQVNIKRDGEDQFAAELQTRPFRKTEEVFFVTVPPASADKYEIEVIDQGAYPFTRVYKGNLAGIPKLSD
ncbi:hypothetical protein [Fulvimonas soli]|uniref:hypothetical protein n=1 Tax=Fulvimonas soli TaxID=155197 RepID=UPI00111CC7B0|nr:hypothetical protein [Fulvimonas soli]